MRDLIRIVENAQMSFDAHLWWNSERTEWYSRYASAHEFKNEHECREWLFRHLEHQDKQSYASLFGINGPDINHSIADNAPIFKSPEGFKIGRKAKPSRKLAKRLGTPGPTGSAPNVDYHAIDLQDANEPVSIESILCNYVPSRDRNKVTVYAAYVPRGLVPDAQLAEDMDDDEEMHGAYDWSQFNARGTYPPLKLQVDRLGNVTIMDGNHRAYYWSQLGFECFPAWVVDYRLISKT